MDKNCLVGPFFYIQGKVYADACELMGAEQNVPGKFDGPGSHRRLYYSGIRSKLKLTAAIHPYEYWPRGRVVYDKPSDTFEISLDACIKGKESIRAKIVKAFHLEGKAISWGLDGHYLCHRCNPYFIDLD